MNQLSYLGGPALYLALVCQCPVLFLYLGDEKDQIQHLQTLTNECKKKMCCTQYTTDRFQYGYSWTMVIDLLTCDNSPGKYMKIINSPSPRQRNTHHRIIFPLHHHLWCLNQYISWFNHHYTQNPCR